MELWGCKLEKEYVVVIQAGGMGTRMRMLTKDKIPKPMLLLNGKPMILWQIENLIKYGFKEFYIITGHLGEKIEEFFGNGEKLGIHISYIRENEPLGSAGALYFIKEKVKDKSIILLFSDVMLNIAWNRMILFHEKKNALATLLVHPNAHPYDSDLLKMNDNKQIVGIDYKSNIRDYWYENIVNAGVYIFDSEFKNQFQQLAKKDLEKDILEPLFASGRIYGYHTSEYVKDAGTVDRFNTCCIEQKAGIWESKCLNRKQRAVFLDRDGTINKFNGLISKEEQFELEDNAACAVKKLNSLGYLAICVTNQPVVARGLCSLDDVRYIHSKLQTLLGKNGAYLDDIVFCPHHPDKGYPEENPKYKIICNCRKPATGMIDAMVEKYNIDLAQSWIIGDSTLDIQLGKNAGVKTILVKTGIAGTDKKYDVQSDYIANDILEAVMLIEREKNDRL